MVENLPKHTLRNYSCRIALQPQWIIPWVSSLLLLCGSFYSFGVPSAAQRLSPPCRVNTFLDYTLCAGDTLQIGGTAYYTPGQHVLSFQSTLGCDSVVNLNIWLAPDTPLVSPHPLSVYVAAGDTATFHSGASTGSQCRWQSQTGPGVWTDVQPDSVHSSPFQPQLRVMATGGNDPIRYRYRCQGCATDARSDSAELRVYPQQAPIGLHIPSVDACLGVNTTIAIRASDWMNVGRISLDLLIPIVSVQFMQWSARIAGMSLSLVGDTLKIRKNTTAPALITSGDTILLLVLRPLVAGVFPLTWHLPDSGVVGLQHTEPNGRLVHRLTSSNGGITVTQNAAQIVQQPASVNSLAGDTVVLAANCLQAIGFQWQIRAGTTWRNLVTSSLFSGVQTSALRMEGVPDSLNNARFRLIALGACGRNDTSQTTVLMVAPTSAAIGLVLPQFPACTTGQYSLPLLVDSLYNVSALSLRFTYNPDSVQFLSVEAAHPSLGTGLQVVQQAGVLTLNWFGVQALQLGSVELLRLRLLIGGNSPLQWDTSAQGTMLLSPYQQRLPTRYRMGLIQYGPLTALIAPIPCLFTGDPPVVLSAWPPGGTFSGTGVQGTELHSGMNTGVRTITYQAYHQGCLYLGAYALEVRPAPTQPWVSQMSVCRGTPVTLTSRSNTSNLWSTGDTVGVLQIQPTQDTLLWVTYGSVTGCSQTDTVRIRVHPGPPLTIDDSIYYYNTTTTPVQLRANGGVQYRWQPSAGLSDSATAQPFAAPDTTTVYMVTATDSHGCSRSANVLVVRPRIGSAPLQYLCRGDSLTLTAPVQFYNRTTVIHSPVFTPPALTYQWQPATGLDDPRSPTPKASPQSTTLYQVQVVLGQGLSLTAQRGILVLNPPRIEIGPDSVLIMAGQSVRLQTFLADTSSPVLLRWSPPDGLSDSTQAQPIATPAVTTTYRLYVQSANGCNATDSIRVIVSQVPTGAVLQGQFIYDNPGQTPMGEGTVTLTPIQFPQPLKPPRKSKYLGVKGNVP